MIDTPNRKSRSLKQKRRLVGVEGTLVKTMESASQSFLKNNNSTTTPQSTQLQMPPPSSRIGSNMDFTKATAATENKITKTND